MAGVSQRFKQTIFKQQRVLAKTLILFAILLFAGGTWGWWHFIYSHPKRVFWGAIGNALQTRSFTRQSVLIDNDQSYIQRVITKSSPKQVVSGVNEIKQENAAGFDVFTEVVGTPTIDYVRYTSIKTDQKDQDGKSLDYKSVLGVWGKTEPADKQTNGQLYNQSVLGVMPFGNLPLTQRRELISLMQSKSTYKTDYSSVKRTLIKSRPVYSYEVVVNAEAYITVLKKYASMVGLTHMSQTSPEDFRTTAALQFRVFVDVWTKQVTKIEYPGGRTETYGSYGIQKQAAAVPAATINIDQLQQRVQAVQ